MKTYFSKTIIAILLVTGIATATFAEETRSVSGFTAIALAGSFHVYVKIDGTESLKISASEKTTNEIKTVVENGTLKISYKNDHEWSNDDNQKADIYITAKSLSSLINSGSGEIKVDGSINTEKFNAVLSGSGSITTNVKADHVSVALSGSGNINLSGSTDVASIAISGSGSLRGKGFKTGTTKVTIAGSGNVSVNAEKELTSNIIGSGSITYSGNATVNSNRIGSGTVRKDD